MEMYKIIYFDIIIFVCLLLAKRAHETYKLRNIVQVMYNCVIGILVNLKKKKKN